MSSAVANYSGKLLVSHPRRRNLYLGQSVVLVVEHTPLGSWGIQINYQHSNQISLGTIIQNQGLWSDLDYPVYFGGQYHHQRCFILHSSDWTCSSTIKINKDLCLSGDMYILSALSEGEGPKRIRPVIGLHQWSAGELDNEIQDNIDFGWLITSPDLKLVFDREGKDQWDRALNQATKTLVDGLLF